MTTSCTNSTNSAGRVAREPDYTIRQIVSRAVASEGVTDICAAAGLEIRSLAVYVLSAWRHSRQAGMKSPRGLRRCQLHLRRRAALRGDRGLPLRGDRLLGEVGEGEILAEDRRKGWRLGVDPISNLTSLLEDRGIKVLVIELPARVSGLTCLVRSRRQRRKIPVIAVNRRAALERRRFTLAHELAHRLIDGGSPVDYERAANVFAGAFLVPRDHLIGEVGAAGRATGN